MSNQSSKTKGTLLQEIAACQVAYELHAPHYDALVKLLRRCAVRIEGLELAYARDCGGPPPDVDEPARREELKARGCTCGASMDYKAGAGHHEGCPMYANAPPHPTWEQPVETTAEPPNPFSLTGLPHEVHKK